METGKTGKYFKYAIGEIILVVIGILIALQINNWNENRKNKNLESDYYCQLLNDLRLDEVQLETLSQQAKNSIKIGKQLIKDLHSLKKEKNELLADYLEVVRSNAYVPTNVTYTDLKSSGSLNLLKNKTVKKMIIKYNTDVEVINKIMQGNQNLRMEKMNTQYEYILDFGYQEPSISGGLNLSGDVLELLPKNNWHLNPNNSYFKGFQEVVFTSMTIANRELQLIKNIQGKMKTLHTTLNEVCND